MTATQVDVTAEIVELLDRYFDGLYHSDAVGLAGVFHPLAVYACATEGTLVWHTMDTYLPIVAARESPASRGDRRDEVIEAIEVAGPVTASVRARCSIGPKRFTDFLSLVRVEERWQIIAKVFHYDLAHHGNPN